MSDNDPDAVGSDGASTGERPVAVALENRLMSHGIYLTSFAWMDESTSDVSDDSATDEASETPLEDGAGIELEYEVVSEAAGVTKNEVGTVLRMLLRIADERAWTPGRLEVTSLTTEGEVRGWWYVEREWFDRLGTELSELEFSERVLDTVKNYQSK